MTRSTMALAALAVLAASCSKAPEETRRERQQSMTEYMSSAKGKADLAKARADGAKRFGGRGGVGTEAARWALAEGTWSGVLQDGRKLEIGVSRDGGGSIEILGTDGRSMAHAATTTVLSRDSIAGTTTAPPPALSPWSRWNLTHSSTGALLRDAKGGTLPVVRR